MIQRKIKETVENSLSAEFNKPVEIFASNTIGGGCINNASKLETNVGVFFMKWNANCQNDIFLREAESLNELKKALGENLTIPKVFAAKEVDSTPGFLVLEYLSSRFSDSNNDEKLGWGLANLHKYSNNKFGFYNNNYCGATLQNNNWTSSWIEFFRDNRLRFLLQLIGNERPLPQKEMEVFDQLLSRIPEIIPESSRPVLIHGDLWSGNYMIAENGPALIDPASYYSDREMEFAIMTMFGGFSSRFYAAYNEVNPLPADWKERNALYQLYHILNHYYLFGGGYLNQAFRIAKQYL